MLQQIISFSARKPWLIILLTTGMAIFGFYAAQNLALDAVPDITNNQVQVVTNAPTLAAQEVEQYITSPLERNLANLPGMSELRSISRYGLSVITVVFDEDVPMLQARQLTRELIDKTTSEIPEGMGSAELMPITTGLGEIYQYVLQVSDDKKSQYSDLELRTIQDWLVKRQLAGIPGIIEVSSFGGRVKQYELAVDPLRLAAFSLSINDVFEAISRNNSNSAASYIAHENNAFYIRTDGMMKSKEDIEQTVIAIRNGVPITAGQIGKAMIGSPPRYGAMTMDGQGEVVGGITLMLKDAHTYQVLEKVKERMDKVQKSLPEGVSIYPYLDRSRLIDATIRTVMFNLLEGGIIVILVLVLLLGNLRAGLIVGSVIPLAMLFALSLMYLFGVSANLMSLGAIDFGIVVDGAVITVEGILHTMAALLAGSQLSRKEIRDLIVQSGVTFVRPATFGVLIILVVFIPVLTLEGIEGKMFRPMAQTLGFALTGALLLTMTYVPALSSLVIKQPAGKGHQLAGKLEAFLRHHYTRMMNKVLNHSIAVISIALFILNGTFYVFTQLGNEFIPTLEEGDMAMQMSVPPGSSLEHSIATSGKAEAILKEHFPEVKHVVSKIGTAEVPTDPMGIEDADVMILLKEKDEWTSAKSREELAEKMKEKLSVLDASFEFTQPIQLRFNELISGAKTDIAVKIFGDDPLQLKTTADEAAEIIQNISGAGDIKVEVTQGMQQWVIKYRRSQMQRHGVSISELNQTIRSAFSGEVVGVIYEQERRFDLVLRHEGKHRNTPDLHQIFIKNYLGQMIPVSECAEIKEETGPNQISREQSRRRIQIGINVRGRDLGSVVNEIQTELEQKLKLPEGYYINYGGQYENLVRARKRLSIALPLALVLIFIFLYAAFRSVKQSIIIFSAIPFAAIGGVWALWLRDMPFSISAGIGFIALFGVAVLNGIVLTSHLNELLAKNFSDLKTTVIRSAADRLRPVLITALVAALGFLPMALSTGNGAEVQRPLATVVVGGLLSSTLLTLIVLPLISYLSRKKQYSMHKPLALMTLILAGSMVSEAQDTLNMSTEDAVLFALQHNREFQISNLEIDKSKAQQQGAISAGYSRFEFQRGQINFEGNDNYLSISQDLGNPVEMFRKYKLAENLTALNASKAAMHQRILIYQVRSACQTFLYHQAKVQIAEEMMKKLEPARNTLAMQHQSGLISGLEYGLLDLQLQDWQSKLSLFRNDLHFAQTELRLLLSTSGQITLLDSFKSLNAPSEKIARNRMFSDLVQLQLQWIEQENKLIRASKFPSLEIGYFNQSLDLVPGFRGYAMSLSMPLFQREIKSKYHISTLALEQKKLETQQSLFKYEQELMRLYTQFAEIQRRLREMNDQQSLFMQAEALFQEGNASTAETYLLFQQMYQYRLQRLDLMNQFNQLILQIEFYVQS